MSILLVEADPGEVALVREVLEASRAGPCHMSRATHLAEAVVLLARDHFDAVLLDLDRPDSSRLDRLARIAQASPETPVVVLTGTADVALETEPVRRGIRSHPLKGEIDRHTLGGGVRHAVERSRVVRDYRRVEQALRRSEAGFRAVIEAIPEAVAIHQHGLLVYLNPAAQRMLGSVDQNELVGKPIADCVDPKDRVVLGELAAAAERGEQPESPRDLRIRCANGDVVSTFRISLPAAGSMRPPRRAITTRPGNSVEARRG